MITKFNYNLPDNSCIQVIATADFVTPYGAQNLKLKFNPSDVVLSNNEFDLIEEEAIERFNEEFENDEFEAYE